MAACTLHWPTVPQAPQWLPLLASALALAKACLRSVLSTLFQSLCWHKIPKSRSVSVFRLNNTLATVQHQPHTTTHP